MTSCSRSLSGGVRSGLSSSMADSWGVVVYLGTDQAWGHLPVFWGWGAENAVAPWLHSWASRGLSEAAVLVPMPIGGDGVEGFETFQEM
jgi:hypothetical protein